MYIVSDHKHAAGYRTALRELSRLEQSGADVPELRLALLRKLAARAVSPEAASRLTVVFGLNEEAQA